jgi:hypothetical protein
MNLKNAKRFLVGLACAAIPLVTTASCDPAFGAFSFFRDDDDRGGFLDVFVDDYYDPCYYDDCYYDEVIVYEEY